MNSFRKVLHLDQDQKPEFTPLFTHLELQHQVHPLLPKWVDVIKDQGDNNVNAIGLMSGDTVLRTSKKNKINKHRKRQTEPQFGPLQVPGFHGRGLGSIQSDSPAFG